MRLGLKKQLGLTLVELMVTITIAAVLLALGVPTMREGLDRNNINKAARDMRTTLSLARDAALTRGVPVRLCPSADQATCGGTYNDGWLIHLNPNSDAVLDANEEVLRAFEGVSNRVDIVASGNAGFTTRGYATAAVTFTFCNASHDTQTNIMRQRLELTASGVVSVVDRGTYTCVAP